MKELAASSHDMMLKHSRKDLTAGILTVHPTSHGFFPVCVASIFIVISADIALVIGSQGCMMLEEIQILQRELAEYWTQSRSCCLCGD
ncbi:hypothetical protein X975_04600, partial [Stegodyphus mimosarum]